MQERVMGMLKCMSGERSDGKRREKRGKGRCAYCVLIILQMVVGWCYIIGERRPERDERVIKGNTYVHAHAHTHTAFFSLF